MTACIDPILTAVIQRRLKSITEEMGLALLRTTRSPILNEARDFVTGLYDEAGDMLEQTEYIPVLAFALQPVCKEIAAFFGDDLHPGDVILHNDVFSGGNQNNDVAAFRPVFVDGELVAWAACKGHQADIGGAVAGGYNPDAREVWQEALRIPPLKVVERGRRREDVWRMVFANIRYPIVEQDIEAQIGGTAVGERGIRELIGRYGLDTFRTHKEELFASTERMVAREIEAIPDGTYRGESTVFYDGVTDGTEMTIRLEVTVEGGGIAFDYSGSSPQTPGFRQRALCGDRLGDDADLPDADRPRHSAQCRAAPADPHRQPGRLVPQRGISGGDDIRQFDHRADLGRDHACPCRRLCRRRSPPAGTASSVLPSPATTRAGIGISSTFCSSPSRAARAQHGRRTATITSG